MDNLIKWTLVLLAIFGVNLIAHSETLPSIAINQAIPVRASSFGKGHVAIALQSKDDDRIMAIVCKGGLWSWNAELILPNEYGEVRILPPSLASLSAAPQAPASPRLPLDEVAAKEICAGPNGHYVIRVAKDAKGNFTVFSAEIK